MTKNLFSEWKKDLPASLVVFLVAVPLCLGISVASKAPPIAGLIAGVIGGIIVGATSGSRLGVSGPAAGLAALVAAAVIDLGSYEAFLVAVVIAGAIQIVLGIVRAGVIAYFFPSSVIKGMLSGIGIFIVLNQIPHAVGYDKRPESDESFLNFEDGFTFSDIGGVLDVFTLQAFLITAVCMAVLLLWETKWIKGSKILSSIPGPLIAVVAGIVLGGLQSGFGDHGLQAEHYVNLPDMSAGFSAFTFPDINVLMSWKVWLTAGTIALVASIETLLSVEATDKLDPEKRITSTDKELRAQGIGNILSGLIGGLPVTQVIVRSSANLQSGAKTRMSAILHGVWILLAVLFIPTVLEMIPLAGLAAILFMVGYKLAKPSLFKGMWAKGWTQFVPFIITVLGVVFINLLTGVMLGMAVGIFIVLRNSYLTPFHFDGEVAHPTKPIRIELSEEVTFFNKASIQRTLANLPRGTSVVIDASRTVSLDPDVLEIIEEEMVRSKDQGITIKLTGVKERPVKNTKKLTDSVVEAAQRDTNGN